MLAGLGSGRTVTGGWLAAGIAETYLMKAVGACTGRTLAQLRAACGGGGGGGGGDLGAVAELARAAQRTMFPQPPLTARKVFAALKEIAHMTGNTRYLYVRASA